MIKRYMMLGFTGVECAFFCNSMTVFMLGDAKRHFEWPF